MECHGMSIQNNPKLHNIPSHNKQTRRTNQSDTVPFFFVVFFIDWLRFEADLSGERTLAKTRPVPWKKDRDAVRLTPARGTECTHSTKRLTNFEGYILIILQIHFFWPHIFEIVRPAPLIRNSIHYLRRVSNGLQGLQNMVALRVALYTGL